MLGRIKKVLKQYTEVDENAISEVTNLQNDLGLNSLDLMNIIVEFEDEFGIQIADEDVESMITVMDIEDYLKRRGIQ